MKPKRLLMTLMILCAGLFILSPQAVMAQSDQASPAQPIKESNSPQGLSCATDKTFTFSSGAKYFKFCLTDAGNIAQLISPAGVDQSTGDEGYVACGTGAANAYSTGFSEAGWGTPTTTSQPGGPNTLPLTIARQSTDGKFELKQTFDWNPAEKEIIITMVLKNLTASSLSNVRLARYFDADLDGTASQANPTDDIYHAESDSVWGRDSGTGAGHHAFGLTALSSNTSHTTAVEIFQNYANHVNGCTTTSEAVPTSPSDFAGRVQYTIGTLAAGASKTVQVLYRRF